MFVGSTSHFKATSLLNVDDFLTPDDSKTIRPYAFEVPAGTPALRIGIDWDPRFSRDEESNRRAVDSAVTEWRTEGRRANASEDMPLDVERYVEKMPNLLNAILVAPDGSWRGRTDRGRGTPRQPLVIAPGHAPLGFLDGPLTPGVWRLDLEVHASVHPGCRVQIQVETCEAPTQTPATSPADGPNTTPIVATPGWFQGELHSHSTHSDGAFEVNALAERARDMGYDFMALTDHNVMTGLPQMQETALPFIPALELTTFYGHHVVLGAHTAVPWHTDGVRRNINDVVADFHEQGALFTLSHPFAIGDPVCTGCRWSLPELKAENIDIVEIWWRRWSGDTTDNRSARLLWDDLWRQGHRPTAVAVRDWHTKQHEAALPGPLPVTMVGAASTDPADLLDAIRRGRAYATCGPQLQFTLSTPLDAHLELGDCGRAAEGHVVATVTLEGLEASLGAGPARAELYCCGEVVAEQTLAESGTFQLEHNATEAGWYRIEIWNGDSPLCITNHIVLAD
jgi:hypothetical protein